MLLYVVRCVDHKHRLNKNCLPYLGGPTLKPIQMVAPTRAPIRANVCMKCTTRRIIPIPVVDYRNPYGTRGSVDFENPLESARIGGISKATDPRAPYRLVYRS